MELLGEFSDQLALGIESFVLSLRSQDWSPIKSLMT